MDEEITVSRELLKAIGADSRVAILKSLLERQKTQSELASELGLSAPTVLEHLEQLEKAGLTERVPEDRERKWKYHKLTKLGRALVERRKVNVVLLLSNVSAAATGALLLLYVAWPFLFPPAAQPTLTGGLSNALSDFGDIGRSMLGVLVMLLLIVTLSLFALRLLKRT